MVHVIYDVNIPRPIYATVQTGSGDAFFEGLRFQRGRGRVQNGRGVLGVLSKFWKYLKPFAGRYIMPMASEAVKAVADEGVAMGVKALTDIQKGKPVEEAVITEGTQALKNLAKRAGSRLTQSGSGKKSRRRAAPRRSVANLHVVGRSVLEKAIQKKRRPPKNLGFF